MYYSVLQPGEALKDAPVNVLDHSAFHKQLQEFVDTNGLVNYTAWKQQQGELKKYLTYLDKNAPQSSWSQEEQFAYYINLYNAATVHLIIDNNMPASIKDISGPLGQVWLKDAAQVGGKKVSLAAIEKNVLQKMGDPRMHFAINCASYSCPKLQNVAYTATSINTMLDKAATQFINSSNNDLRGASIKLSKIFDWYAADFTASGLTITAYINQYAAETIDANAKITYIDYDWSLNKQP